jgi:hypothetical protein
VAATELNSRSWGWGSRGRDAILVRHGRYRDAVAAALSRRQPAVTASASASLVIGLPSRFQVPSTA